MHISYCLKCKEKHEMVNPEIVEMKNGRNRISGKCKKCNSKTSLLIKNNK